VTPQDLDFLCALVQARSGLILTGERGFFAESRLAPLARREGLSSVSEVIVKLTQAPWGPLARAVVEAMTVQETAFFRDRQAFQQIGGQILPELGAANPKGIRIWSAGCGQGQEAYSLAMLAAEIGHALPPVDILATDLSSAALDKAQAGVYTHFEVQRGLPIRRLLAHFEELEDAWRVSSPLRQTVRWLRLNLIDPFTVDQGYELILCRNVISNFSAEARSKVLARLEQALSPGGFLMLGEGEWAPEGFQPVPGAPCVFSRIGEAQSGIAA